jgi:hypothetical protein
MQDSILIYGFVSGFVFNLGNFPTLDVKKDTQPEITFFNHEIKLKRLNDAIFWIFNVIGRSCLSQSN